MKDPFLLHMFNPTKNVSPFDVNMAYEAEYDGVIPYGDVSLDDIHALTQDTIFSRSPTGVKRTSIFIGGRSFGLAIDMLNRAKAAMVPPFEISVFADPSGAITTAAAMIACVERCVKNKTGDSLEGKSMHIIGGTGPVGVCAGIIAANCGADVYLLSSRGIDVAQEFAEENNGKFNVDMSGGDGSSNKALGEMIQGADIVIGSAKAGMQVLSKAQLEGAEKLIVAADALGIGALAMGNIKYKVHYRMFEMMKETDKPLYLDHEEAFKVAREYAAE
jgi:methylene-tetrahydromethanopterin dehydrogenase